MNPDVLRPSAVAVAPDSTQEVEFESWVEKNTGDSERPVLSCSCVRFRGICCIVLGPPAPVRSPVAVSGPSTALTPLYSVPRTMAEYSYVKSTKLVLKGTKAKR